MKDHADHVHENIRNNMCDFCERKFSKKIGLIQHINALHKNLRTHVCKLYDKSFTKIKYFEYHLQKYHDTQKEDLQNISNSVWIEIGKITWNQ